MNEIDQIRQQMAQIRHDLHKDVSGVVNGVAEVMDWRSLLQRYPLTSVCAALAAGYLVVPGNARQASEPAPEVTAVTRTGPARPWNRIVGRTIHLLWPIAEQAIQSYALIWVDTQIKQYLHRNPAGPPPAGPENRQAGHQRDVNVFSIPVNDR